MHRLSFGEGVDSYPLFRLSLRLHPGLGFLYIVLTFSYLSTNYSSPSPRCLVSPDSPPSVNSHTTITIGSQTIECDAGDLESLEELGRGAYGVVEKMKHRPSGTIMAVKVSYGAAAIGKGVV